MFSITIVNNLLNWLSIGENHSSVGSLVKRYKKLKSVPVGSVWSVGSLKLRKSSYSGEFTRPQTKLVTNMKVMKAARHSIKCLDG